MIIISFDDQHLHDTCLSLQAAEALYGAIHAQELIAFISDANSFENAAELVGFLGNRAQIADDDSLSIEIGSEYLATLKPVGQRYQRDRAGRVIWATVNRLKVMIIMRRL